MSLDVLVVEQDVDWAWQPQHRRGFSRVPFNLLNEEIQHGAQATKERSEPCSPS
jgi:hypothetical protein